MTKTIQAKHIDDAAILAIIDETREREGRWTFTWDIEAALANIPPKVVLAKLRSMVRRGVIDGCACGCRGDFQRPSDPIAKAVLASLPPGAVVTSVRVVETEAGPVASHTVTIETLAAPYVTLPVQLGAKL